MQRKKSNKRPLGYRKKALAMMKAKYPHYVLKSNFLGALFIIGLILTIWQIGIFRETFISVYIPLSIWLITGIVITPFFKKIFNIYCFNPYTPERTHLFFHCFYNVAAFGGMTVFLFMWTNQTFNNNSKVTKLVPIISYGHLAKSKSSCALPYVYINYKDEEKQLIFPCDAEVDKFSRVNLEVVKGLYGYDIITDKTLIEGQW